MDAEKVLPWLRSAATNHLLYGHASDYTTRGCAKCGRRQGEQHRDDCELNQLIAEIEHEAQTGGWKPGSEPPSHDEYIPVILTAIILDDGIPRYGRVCAKYDLRAQSWRDYFGQLRADVLYYHDIPTWQPPLPEQSAAGKGEAGS